MTSLRGVGAALILVAACSDDGLTPAAGSTGGGGDDPFVTSLPPTSADSAADDGGASSDTLGADAESTGGAGSTGPGPLGTDTGEVGSTGTTGGDTGVGVTVPAAGEILITEIMQNPGVLADADGEWFELHNPDPAATYQLQGCVVEGTMNDTPFTIDVDLPVGPGGFVIIATMSAVGQGFVADFQWNPADFQLNNTSDTVRLVCDGVTVDEVSYDNGVTFPDPTGASMTLDPGSFDATANDDGTNWCAATSDYNGDLGTPGTANDSCM